MDDEIIYSWCFNSVEYFDSASSAAMIVLVEELEIEKGKDRPRFGRPNQTETVGLSKWALTVSIEIRFGPARVFGLGPKRKENF